MHKLLELTIFFVIIGAAMANLMVGSSTISEQHVNAQNMTNASTLTGIEQQQWKRNSETECLFTPPEPEPLTYIRYFFCDFNSLNQRIAKHSSLDHTLLMGIILFVGMCHQPTKLLHLKHRIAISLPEAYTDSMELSSTTQ